MGVYIFFLLLICIFQFFSADNMYYSYNQSERKVEGARNLSFYPKKSFHVFIEGLLGAGWAQSQV